MRRLITLLKLIAFLGVSTILLLTQNKIIIAVLFALICFVVFLYPNRRIFLRRFLPLILLSLLFVLLQFIWNNINYSLTAIITLVLKITSLSLLVFYFTVTTSMASLISVFTFLPNKCRIVLMIAFGIIPIMIREAWQIKLVQHTRGVNAKFWNLPKTFFPIIIPLLRRSFLRAERIALLCKFYS
jgi:energy-coupling factor transporter transmembrane protein EcfT